MDLKKRLSDVFWGDIGDTAQPESFSKVLTSEPFEAAPTNPADDQYQEVKNQILVRLLDRLDLSSFEQLPETLIKAELVPMVERLLVEEFTSAPLNFVERQHLVEDIQHEILGLGPLEPLLQDTSINDILVNSYSQVYVERRGRLELTPVRFHNDAHLRRTIDRIVNRVGRRIDESSPMVDARLPDGSRVNAIIPPLALDGPALSIRKFAADPLEMEDLLGSKTLLPHFASVLQGIVHCRLNVLISGGTGSGKTTMLNVLSRYIPPTERIVTIEDAAELQLKQPHVVRLETRPPNIEGKGVVTQRDLVINALRMRPDRIILGEVRGPEALDMLQAMNTGHDGSLTTVHANSSRDAIMRLETMVSMAGLQLPTVAMRRYISSAIDVVIQVGRLADGSRKLLSLSEITGMEGEMISMQDIFTFEQSGIDQDGRVRGRFVTTGVFPQLAKKMAAYGLRFDEGIFTPGFVDA